MTQASLDVLQCPSCRAPVAIAAAATTRCAHCGSEVTIPDAHRQALELVEQQVKADALTQRAFRILGRPPMLPLRAFSFITAGVTVFLCCFYIRFINGIEAWVAAVVETHHHLNFYDWYTPRQVWMLRWGLLGVVCFIGVILGALGRRRAVTRAALKAALHARPPSKPGGPALCRECGAPLTVPADAWGVRCAYCSADNLTAIPQEWLSAARQKVKNLAKEAREAIRQQRNVDYHFRRDLFRSAGLILAAFLLMEGWMAFRGRNEVLEADDYLPLAVSASPRKMVGREIKGPGQPPPPGRIPLDGCSGAGYRLPASDYVCEGSNCFAGWFVGLRAGERLVISPRVPGGATLAVHDKDTLFRAEYRALWGKKVASVSFDGNHLATMEAPLTAWYRLELVATLDDPGSGLPLCGYIE